jgi:hypothetical protein
MIFMAAVGKIEAEYVDPFADQGAQHIFRI